MRTFHTGAHRRRVIETQQAVRIVDQHVEVLKKILAQDSLNVEPVGLQIVETENEHLQVSESMGPGFKQVEFSRRGRCLKSDTRDRFRTSRGQSEFYGH